MRKQEIKEILKKIKLFSGLRQDDWRDLIKVVHEEEYQAPRVLGKQGESGTDAYVVVEGALQISRLDDMGVEKVVGRLGPGDFFGETSLLLGEPLDVTVSVVENARLLRLNKDEFATLLEEHPDIVKRLQMRKDVATKYRARAYKKKFKWLDDDEVVMLCKHRHDAVLMRNLIVPVSIFAGTVMLGLFLRHVMPPPLLTAIMTLVIGILVLVVAYLVIDHRDERYIVTNKRVIRREHNPLGRESRMDAPLDAIQDIQEVQTGLLAQIYDFGDLIIETAGEKGHIAFREIPDPEGVREIIFEQIHRLRVGAKLRERKAIREDMGRYFRVQAEESAEEPQPLPAPEQPRRKSLLRWLKAPVNWVRYFLPPLWHEEGDTITWRKHWVALLKPIFIPTLLGLLAMVGTLIVGGLGIVSWSWALVGYGISLVIVLPWWLWKFDDWQNDIYQVTKTRIIDVERLPFYLREDRREASLGMIQNIKFEIPGLIGKLLNYGSVTIETAGAGPFTFDYVKNPSGVQAEIFRRMDAFKKRQERAAAERHRRELLDWFAVYDQMRQAADTQAEEKQ